jgi:enoyl-CoA hydratase
MADEFDYKLLRVEREGGLLTIWLNDPDEGNAIKGPMHHEIIHLLRRIQDDPEVRVVILTGTGAFFSARRDSTFIEWARTVDEVQGSLALNVPFYIRNFVQTILDVEVPIIAAINGDATGIGATVALFCDITVMDETAMIADKHGRYGVTAGDGGQVIWPLLVGPNRAKDFLMRGIEIGAVEAERIGLVNYVAPAGQSLSKAREIADDLLARAPWAVRFTKSAINQQVRAQFLNAMPLGAALEGLTITSRDHATAIKALAQGVTPDFEGK